MSEATVLFIAKWVGKRAGVFYVWITIECFLNNWKGWQCVIDPMSEIPHFPLPTLEEQADLAEQHGVEILFFCPNPWVIGHVFINQQTGEKVRARFNRWDCLYGVPRKVDQWRQLVKTAEPPLFLTLTKAGKTGF